MDEPTTPPIWEVCAEPSSRETSKKQETTPLPQFRADKYLEMLRHDYELTKNPVFVLQALVMAARQGEPVPVWVLDFFGSVAAPGIMNTIYDAGHDNEGQALPHSGKMRSEAELIGKALGFSTTGRGSKSLLAEGANLDRAWEIHSLVRRKLQNSSKESSAFCEAGTALGLSASTIRREYLRIEHFLRQKELAEADNP